MTAFQKGDVAMVAYSCGCSMGDKYLGKTFEVVNVSIVPHSGCIRCRKPNPSGIIVHDEADGSGWAPWRLIKVRGEGVPNVVLERNEVPRVASLPF